MFKYLSKLKPEQQLLLAVAIIVIISSLFWRNGSQPFSIGASAHFGNLKGKVELEAFDEDADYINRKKAFTLFYVPWCGYCKNVLPIWDKLSQKYQNNGNDVNVIKINCEKYTNLATQHGIESYPTIRFYPNGLQDYKNYITYVDSRDLSSFTRFLEAHSTSRVGTESFTNSFVPTKYNSPVGYNDFEIFEPFDQEEDE